MDLKEAVLARVDLVELAGQYTALTLAGREWRGRCPFHQEKTPSFWINPEKGVYHCHGCKAGGNAIGFVMAIENLEFRDALEWLARRYNVEVPAEQRGRGFASGEKQRLFELNEAAASYYREQLRGPAGAAAREYLAQRGVDSPTAAQFDLGYAPREWTALTDHLLSRGAKSAELVKLSLIRSRDRTADGPSAAAGQRPAVREGGHYDYLRHRLTFAIRDVTGRVIGFAGRALSAEDNPKYLNVAATPLYDKSRVLYNLDRAKGRLREDGAVVVEGYMDVIGLAQAGVLNTVAACGTALTEEHVKLLDKYAPAQVYLAFDGDDAGQRAAWSAGMLLLRHGYSPRVLQLPAGVDPDDFARQQGLDAWRGLTGSSVHVVALWLSHQLAHNPNAGVAQLHRWVMELAGLYRALPSELHRQEYFRAVASALKLDEPTVHGLLTSVKATTGARAAGPQQRGATSYGTKAEVRRVAYQQRMAQGIQPIEREVLRRLLTDAEFRFYYTAQPDAAEWFEDAVLREVYQQLAAGAGPEAVTADERNTLLLSEVLMAEPLADSNEQLLLRHNNLHLERRITQLSAEFRAASAAGNVEQEHALHLEVLALKKQLRPVRGLESSGAG